MNKQDKTKDELILELEALQKKHQSLKDCLGKNIAESKLAKDTIQQKNKSLVALLEISQSLTKSLNKTTVLQTIVDSATSLFDLDSGAIYLLKGEDLILEATTPALPPQFPAELRHALLSDHPHIIKATSSKSPVIIPDTKIANLSPAEQAVCDSRNLSSLLYLPLLIDKRTVGVIILGTIGNNSRLFSEEEINLYQTFAGQATMAIENARLYEETQKNAEKLEKDILERKNAERKIKESKDYLTNIIDSVALPIFVKDKNHKFYLVNEAFCTMLNRSYNDIIGSSGYEYFPKEQMKVFIDKDEEVFKTGKENINEELLTTGNGKTLTLITKKSLYTDSNGNKFLVGVINDITERKLVEKALQESEEFLRKSQEVAQIGSYSLDITTGIWKSSETLDAIFGIDKDYIHTIENWAMIIDPEWRETMVNYLSNEILLKHERFDKEYQINQQNNNKICWVHGLGELEFDNNGNPTRMFGTIQDITERKQAEIRLKKSEEKFHSLFSVMLEGLYLHEFIYNKNGKAINYRIIETNPASELHLNIKSKDAIGKLATELYGTKEAPYIKTYDKVEKSGTPYQFEEYFEPLKKYFHITVYSPQKGRFATIFSDITERKHAEQKLKESKERLERSNIELEQFAYVASHDLQEPLRMVSSYTQLLEKRYKDKLDQDATEFIHYAVDGAIRMQKLLNDLLEYSRIGSKKKTFEQIDIAEILEYVISNLQLLIADNSVEITTDDLPIVTADGSQLLRIFQNLIENAIKFRKPKQLAKIHISCTKKNNLYQFSIADNGIGMEMKYHERVFVIFQRLHPVKDYPGTGIGLSISKRIIERHGGTIWFESTANKGTTFYFTIPI